MFEFIYEPDRNVYQYSSYGCLSAATFTIKLDILALSLCVKDKLDVGLPPNHHAGNIPIIQFGDGLPVRALPA